MLTEKLKELATISGKLLNKKAEGVLDTLIEKVKEADEKPQTESKEERAREAEITAEISASGNLTITLSVGEEKQKMIYSNNSKQHEAIMFAIAKIIESEGDL